VKIKPLELLFRELPKRGTTWGRKSKRDVTKRHATLVVGPKGDKKDYPCQLIDTSQEGMRLKADVELSPGDVVDVIPSEGSWFTIRCHVVWVGEPGSKQVKEAGLKLLNPFSQRS
jgi:hypothetical protein